MTKGGSGKKRVDAGIGRIDVDEHKTEKGKHTMRALTIMFVAALFVTAASQIQADERTFGDGTLPDFLAVYDTDGDGKLSEEERQAMKEARKDKRDAWIADATQADGDRGLSNGQLAYAALLERARRIELASIDRLEEQQRERAADWRRTPAYNDLLRRAEAVDSAANARLAELAARYHLTEEQQIQIFPTLAVSSPEYHPALEMDGEVASAAAIADDLAASAAPIEKSTIDDALHDVLDGEQQDALEDDWVDRDLWWTEIVSQLTEDLDEDLAAMVDSDNAAGDGDGEDYDDGGNLFDLMK